MAESNIGKMVGETIVHGVVDANVEVLKVEDGIVPISIMLVNITGETTIITVNVKADKFEKVRQGFEDWRSYL